MSPEEDLWVHGKLVSDALRQVCRSAGIPVPIGVENSIAYFSISQSDSSCHESISVCQTRRIHKDGPGLWCVMEDDAAYRFRHQGLAFDQVMKALSIGFHAGGGPVLIQDLNTTTEALKKNKARVIKRLRNEGAINTADYLQSAIQIHANDTFTLHDLQNSGCLIYG